MAYYAANTGEEYSKSLNASLAEDGGKWPRTVAAKVLGISVAAFDAGCDALGYTATEWHHVGKYATEVYYYDALELSRRHQFWEGAASRYKVRKIVKRLLRKAALLKHWHRHAPLSTDIPDRDTNYGAW